jgi:D-alanyl-D-alanine carboxypeptidase (penicillin-binding protein 5/6)
MRIIYLSKKRLTGFALIILAGIAVLLGWNPSRETGGSGYKIRPWFPPLVYLPGYQNGPKVYATAAILIESKSGAILYAKNEDMRRAPASTTKMMTAIVALERGNLNQVVRVSRRAASTGGSSIGIRAGDRLTLKELLEGTMLESGNNGSIAVAEGVAGSVDGFVKWMNSKAKEIGALNTNFQNPHGLRAPSHYTTALDLAVIARYGLVDPRFAGLVKKRSAKLEWAEDQRSQPISNTNRLLWSLEGADGVKTGTTSEAGYCLVASATRDGQQYIAVVLNSGDRWGDCARMLEYAFKEFTILKIADQRQPVCRVKVIKSRQKEITLYPRSTLYAVIRKGEEGLVIRQLNLPRNPVTAPIRPGQALGKLGYRYQNQTVEGVDLISERPVPKRRWFW